jgi:hypothetical protein
MRCSRGAAACSAGRAGLRVTGCRALRDDQNRSQAFSKFLEKMPGWLAAAGSTIPNADPYRATQASQPRCRGDHHFLSSRVQFLKRTPLFRNNRSNNNSL